MLLDYFVAYCDFAACVEREISPSALLVRVFSKPPCAMSPWLHRGGRSPAAPHIYAVGDSTVRYFRSTRQSIRPVMCSSWAPWTPPIPLAHGFVKAVWDNKELVGLHYWSQGLPSCHPGAEMLVRELLFAHPPLDEILVNALVADRVKVQA